MRQAILNLEKRSENRRPLYRGELADITLRLNETDYSVHAYDLSPDGMGVIVEGEFDGEALNCSVHLRLPGAKTKLSGIITHKSYVKFGGKKRCKLGIRFNDPRREAVLRDKRRFSLLHDCQPAVQLYFERPGGFGQMQHAQVVDLSRDGFAFTMDRRNSVVLIRSMLLAGKIVLPTGIPIQVHFEVRYSRLQDGKRIYGCRLLETSSEFSGQMAEFLLHHADQPSLRQLEAEGFQPNSIASSLRFAYAGPREYSEILGLRRSHAHAGGLMLDCEELLDFSDERDAKSRQLYCELAGRIVGAASLSFPDQLQSKEKGSNHPIPSFIRAGGFLELSQFCFHHDFMSEDIFLGILQHATRVAVENKLAYVLIHSHDEYPELLTALGAAPLDVRDLDGGTEAHPLKFYVLEISATLLGERQGPWQWARFSKPLCDKLLERGLLHPSFWDRLRLMSYQTILDSSDWWRQQWKRKLN